MSQGKINTQRNHRGWQKILERGSNFDRRGMHCGVGHIHGQQSPPSHSQPPSLFLLSQRPLPFSSSLHDGCGDFPLDFPPFESTGNPAECRNTNDRSSWMARMDSKRQQRIGCEAPIWRVNPLFTGFPNCVLSALWRYVTCCVSSTIIQAMWLDFEISLHFVTDFESVIAY